MSRCRSPESASRVPMYHSSFYYKHGLPLRTRCPPAYRKTHSNETNYQYSVNLNPSLASAFAGRKNPAQQTVVDTSNAHQSHEVQDRGGARLARDPVTQHSKRLRRLFVGRRRTVLLQPAPHEAQLVTDAKELRRRNLQRNAAHFSLRDETTPVVLTEHRVQPVSVCNN